MSPEVITIHLVNKSLPALDDDDWFPSFRAPGNVAPLIIDHRRAQFCDVTPGGSIESRQFSCPAPQFSNELIDRRHFRLRGRHAENRHRPFKRDPAFYRVLRQSNGRTPACRADAPRRGPDERRNPSDIFIAG